MIGVDLDAYKPKAGGRTSAEAEAESGPLPVTWRTTSRADDQYRCNNLKSKPGSDHIKCECCRLNADWFDGKVWSAVTEVLSDSERLMSPEADYLGLRQEAAQPETETLARIDTKIAGLQRDRIEMVTEYLRAGIDAATVAAGAAQIDEEIRALADYREQLDSYRSDARAEQERATALASLAQTAAERLPSMGLAQQAEVLRLLQVKVTLLDQTVTPDLRIEGVVPDGVDLFAAAEDGLRPVAG